MCVWESVWRVCGGCVGVSRNLIECVRSNMIDCEGV